MAKPSNSDKYKSEGINALDILLEEAQKVKKPSKKDGNDPENTFLSDSGEVIKFKRKHPQV